MISNLVVLLVLIALVVLLFLFVRRAAQARHWYLKWPGVVLGSLLALLLALLSVVAARGMSMFYLPGGSPVQEVKVAGTPEQIARGQHIANALCAECHTTTGQLPLTGGRDMGAEAPLPLGSFARTGGSDDHPRDEARGAPRRRAEGDPRLPALQGRARVPGGGGRDPLPRLPARLPHRRRHPRHAPRRGAPAALIPSPDGRGSGRASAREPCRAP